MDILKDHFTLSNGLKIPKIGFGTAPLKGEEAYQAVIDALNFGYLHIDTAQNYQNEDMVGKAIHDLKIDRKKIFVTSKLDASIKNYDEALKAFEGTMNRLNLKTLDLYLIHAPWPWDQKFSDHKQGNIEAYKALEKLYKDGKVKSIGVSNFSKEDLENIIKHCDITPHVNQIKYHIGYNQDETIQYCQEHNILVEAYSPLGRGGVLKHKDVLSIANKHNVSTAQVCIQYILQKNILPLPRSSKYDHIKSNATLDFTINEIDMKALDALDIETIEFGTPVKK